MATFIHIQEFVYDKYRFTSKTCWISDVKEQSSLSMRLAEVFIDEYLEQYPEAIDALRQRIEDSLQFFSFEDFDSKKIPSMNM